MKDTKHLKEELRTKLDEVKTQKKEVEGDDVKLIYAEEIIEIQDRLLGM